VRELGLSRIDARLQSHGNLRRGADLGVKDINLGRRSSAFADSLAPG